MKTLILKFGGAALKDDDHLKKAADIVLTRQKEYQKVVVVVSAMGNMTDELLALVKKFSSNPPKREQDMLVSVGERISMALLATVFADAGHEALSLTGSQAGIITTNEHSDAKIIDVRPRRILTSLEQGKIVIVAGFQGVSVEGEITTLGRGGSDTTAVALGVGLKADMVEFYKDVGGVYTSDPKKDVSASKIAKLQYVEALEIIERAERKLLHPRAVRLAEKNGLCLYVRSFENEEEGSLIGSVAVGMVGSGIYE